MKCFKDFISAYVNDSESKNKIAESLAYLYPIFANLHIEDNDKYFKDLKCFHESVFGKHFNEFFAINQVSKMYHTTDSGIICRGEKYGIAYAQCVHKDWVKKINLNITEWDVYVALNAQYHDHIIEYIDWFENPSKAALNDRIVEATINFWFMDEDAGNCKVWNYFKNIG